GILLLGHEAASGGVFVGKNDVGKLLRCEKDEIFGEARDVRGDARESEKIIEGEVAIADRVEAVGSDARKTKLARNSVAIDGKRTSSKGARAHGAGIGGVGGMLQPGHIAGKGLGVRQQEMRQKNW